MRKKYREELSKFEDLRRKGKSRLRRKLPCTVCMTTPRVKRRGSSHRHHDVLPLLLRPLMLFGEEALVKQIQEEPCLKKKRE
jgi:hypothetical protein